MPSSNPPGSPDEDDDDAEENPADAPITTGPRRPSDAQFGPEPVWQPGFHQALRWSKARDGVWTYRFKIPITRTGSSIRVAFLGGDGASVIQRATVARAGANGALASNPIQLTFNGHPLISLAPRERVVSDALPLPVQAMDELYVSFEGEGSFASSAIGAFPESYAMQSTRAFDLQVYNAEETRTLVGVNTIDVEGPPALSFVAIGDSITEGYVHGHDDLRDAWPMQTAMMAGVSVVNGAVSGQGVWEANHRLKEEVLVLSGVTDCMVLIGTNDLAAHPSAVMADRLTILFDSLRPFCRIWAGTLLPKEMTTSGDLELVNSRRRAVNSWLRSSAAVDGVIDFARAMQLPGDPDAFVPGYDVDGIHPSVAGHRQMGSTAAAFISSAQLPLR